ncbi:hypothetical protein FQZ97_1029430 [compost metagenome]
MPGRQLAAGTGLVFHHHGLAERGLQLGRDGAGHEVGAAAGWVGDDQRDRLAAGDPALRMRADPGGGQGGARSRDEGAAREPGVDGNADVAHGAPFK